MAAEHVRLLLEERDEVEHKIRVDELEKKHLGKQVSVMLGLSAMVLPNGELLCNKREEHVDDFNKNRHTALPTSNATWHTIVEFVPGDQYEQEGED
jgi:hypothetical protein